MGDRDDGARVLLEEVFEPGHRFGVEMVGWFVQQQHVGFRQQQPAQRDAALLAAGKRADQRLPGRQAQRVGGDLELALQFPAADRVDRVLHLRLFVHEAVHLVVGHRLGEAVADRVEPVDEALHVADAFADDRAHRLALVEQRFLRQVADLDARLRARLALDVLVDARHDLQQRRFAGAIQAEYADLGAGEEAQADVAQNDALGRHDLANPVHRVDELSHRCPVLGIAADYPRLAPACHCRPARISCTRLNIGYNCRLTLWRPDHVQQEDDDCRFRS